MNDIMDRMNCPICGLNHSKYATKKYWNTSLRCSCGAISYIAMQLGDDGTDKDVEDMPQVFSLCLEDENIDNRIVTALVRAFDNGLRITDYMGGLEEHIEIRDLDQLLDWSNKE